MLQRPLGSNYGLQIFGVSGSVREGLGLCTATRTEIVLVLQCPKAGLRMSHVKKSQDVDHNTCNLIRFSPNLTVRLENSTPIVCWEWDLTEQINEWTSRPHGGMAGRTRVVGKVVE